MILNMMLNVDKLLTLKTITSKVSVMNHKCEKFSTNVQEFITSLSDAMNI